MKKQCENILLFLDEELKEEEKRDFKDHLESCEDCKSFLSSYKERYETISSPAPGLKSDQKQELWKSIESSINNTINNSWQMSKKWLVAAAVALFALNIFNVYTVFQNKDQSYYETQIAYESTSEDWYEDSALDKMIYDLSENGGGNNE
ncbi:MAG: zf-HC2 domain-containing protein [Calditrichia bacterium]|nr:zf-HC2 domain-containing protein [Calditrichia bacterium]